MSTKKALALTIIGLVSSSTALAGEEISTFGGEIGAREVEEGSPLEFGPPPSLDNPAPLPPGGWLFGEELPEVQGVPENPDAASPTIVGKLLQWFWQVWNVLQNSLGFLRLRR